MALREINLIPAETLSRRRLLRHLIFWGGCMLVSFVMISGYGLYQSRIVLAKQRSMITLTDMHTHLGTRIEEIKRIQNELERLDQQQDVLETITRDQPYSRLLYRLAGMMNDETWLTKLNMNSSNETENPVKLTLTGYSFSNAELGNFMSRFSAEPIFTAVRLQYAKEIKKPLPGQKNRDPVNLIQFEIDCHITSG